jgi:hypothetical protein
LLIALVVYLVLSIGALRNETNAMWQEIALLRIEYDGSATENQFDGTDDGGGHGQSEVHHRNTDQGSSSSE